MPRWICTLFAVLTLGFLVLPGAALAGDDLEALVGSWEGDLQAGAMTLSVRFNLKMDPEGFLIGTMDSMSQGVNDIPLGAVTRTGDSVVITVPTVGGSFDGTFDASRNTMNGTWSQSGQELPLELTYAAIPTAAKRKPQEPIAPYPYIVEEVSFPNKAAGIHLTGTLTRPRGGGPWPAAVLISGSGAQNRDEELFGHKPFWVLADHLTTHTIAVLRFDDRGVGGSGGDPNGTSVDFKSDVAAAVAYLRTRSEVDQQAIGLIGHSEGGIIAPMVAAEDPSIAFIVLLAGTGVSGAELMPEQIEQVTLANGASAAIATWARESWEAFIPLVLNQPDDELAKAEVQHLMEERYEAASAEMLTDIGPRAQQTAVMQQFITPWFRFFLAYDPAPTLEKVSCPVLALNGQLDRQVPSKMNLTAIAEALKAGGNPDYTVMELAGLNHLFQTSTTGGPSEYALIEETFAPEALNTISGWILQGFEDD